MVVNIKVDAEFVARALNHYTDTVGKIRNKKIAIEAVKRFIRAFGCEISDDHLYDTSNEKEAIEWKEGLLWAYQLATKFNIIRYDTLEYLNLKKEKITLQQTK